MKLFYILLGIVLVFSCTRDTSPTQPTGDFGSGETYAVYSAVLNSLKSDYFTGCILMDSTQSFPIDDRREKIRETMPSLQSSVLDAYTRANRIKREIQHIPDVNLNIYLVNCDEAPSVFDLKTKYPDAEALMELSNVGFNADKTQALVYYSQLFAPLAGHGVVAFLVKNEKWRVQQTLMVWIS